ncbi:endonuclease/exonuclease/phosphatase family protein [Rubrivirga sp.]|uniref:endonuclease/exonuclease/phosphatase family protein n=1 Tax=Rubrivirga sp. TaxID=1885344 RepID=UPI003C7612D5
MRYALALLVGLAGLAALAGCSTAGPVTDPVRGATALLPGYAYPAGDTVRVATYNLEHFVDAFDSPYIGARRESEATVLEVDARNRLAVDALRALDADVVALQEVEGEGLVRALVDSLAPDLGYRFVASADDADWYMNVVVLSRLPLGPLTTFADAATPIPGFQDDDGRPEATDLANHRLLAVDVYARPGYTFTLVAAHLKAGRSARDEAWRTGQAGLLHAWLGQRFGDPDAANVVFAGDLNAIPGTPSFDALLNADRALGPVRFQDPLAGTSAFSHPADDPVRRLDHVLVSDGAAPEAVPGSAAVVSPIEDARRLSDHLPVVLEVVARDR